MKFGIDLGHGCPYDGGAVGIIKEEYVINTVGSKVISKLQNSGHEVIQCRPSNATSTSNSLNQRANKANSNKVDMFISLHANAGGGIGSEIYTYNGKNIDAANRILNNMSSLGFKNRGIKNGSNLAVIRLTEATSMIIEICFIDTQNDVNLFNKVGAESIANMIVEGLLNVKINNSSNNIDDNLTTSNPLNINKNRDQWIARLQNECNKQGFSNQVVDGIAGPITLAGCPMVKIGATGNITKLLQEKMNILGFSAGNEDGIFGKLTKAAIMKYQSSRGLYVDGIVGEKTWSKLLGLN